MAGSIPWAYGVWLAVVALQRVGELLLSRAHVERDARRASPSASEGTSAWVAMVASHVALLVLPPIEIVALDRRPPAWLALGAFGAFLLAQVLRVWAIRSLGPAWNARAIVDTARPLVRAGPYRWIRHPNYLAVCIEFVTIPLGGGAWIACVLLNAFHWPVLARRIEREERLLALAPGWNDGLAARNRFLPWATKRR